MSFSKQKPDAARGTPTTAPSLGETLRAHSEAQAAKERALGAATQSLAIRPPITR